MKEATQIQFTALAMAMAATYGVADVSKAFTVNPSLEQTLVAAIQESTEFLSKINMPMVQQQTGEVLGLGVTGSVTGRTDTSSGGERTTKSAHGLSPNPYSCLKTEADIHITYQQMDAWARFPNFAELVQQAVMIRMALDMLKIGFNGTSAAATTVAADLSDVNIGWLKNLKDNKSSNYLLQGGTAGQIKVGASGDYKNLDNMVRDVRNMIDTEYASSGDLVAIIGRDLVANDQGKMYAAQGATPTEKERLQNQQVIATYGGLPSLVVPEFPAKGLLITSLDNLSIYTQEGSIRRAMIDNPKKDRVEHYNSRNEAYVIEHLGKAAAIEAANVVFVN